MRLADVLASWIDTPYGKGQAVKGRAADCVHFVDAVLCEWRGVALAPLPRLPTDAGFHDRKSFILMRRAMLARHPYRVLLRRLIPTEVARPGDVFAMASSVNPHHLGIVGEDGRELWHASRIGVVQSSVAGIRGAFKVVRAYRLIESPSC